MNSFMNSQLNSYKNMGVFYLFLAFPWCSLLESTMSWTTSNPYSHHYDIPSQHIPKAMILTKHRLKLLTQMIIFSCELFLRYLSPWQKVWLTHQATQKRVVIISDIWAWSWREHPFICVIYKFCSLLSKVIWKSGVWII